MQKKTGVLLLAALKEQEYIGKCLKKLIQSYNKIFLRQVQTIWEDGIHQETRADVVAAVSSCSATNQSGARQFGKVDHLIQRALNISVGKLQAKGMTFSLNDTGTWP